MATDKAGSDVKERSQKEKERWQRTNTEIQRPKRKTENHYRS